MKYRYQKVDRRLTDYVRTVLVCEDRSDAESSDLPLFTKGMPALLCRITKEGCQTTIFGRSVPDNKWAVERNATLIVFFFKPFVLGTIFKLSAQKMKENPIELDHLGTSKTKRLNVQLSSLKPTKEKIDILNHFLLSQIQKNQRECDIIRYATDKLLQNSDANSLSKILKELCLTERTFQRVFKKYLGLSPNQYRRICQFQVTFLQLKGRHFCKQTDVAYNNAYFDQSHYIRSFKEFTGTTPNEYLQNGLDYKTK